MTVVPVLVSLAVRFAGRAPTLASALSTALFNLGTAVGSWIAGIALESSLQEFGPPLVGTAFAALTLIPLGILAAKTPTPSQRIAHSQRSRSAST
jgi:predicted MFS family arabinose efflux permease